MDKPLAVLQYLPQLAEQSLLFQTLPLQRQQRIQEIFILKMVLVNVLMLLWVKPQKLKVPPTLL